MANGKINGTTQTTTKVNLSERQPSYVTGSPQMAVQDQVVMLALKQKKIATTFMSL